ncbi:hypothetical protein ACMXYR_02755 [Neptuniibacter sp. QD29_5]|uniref:hypothetical protein n=1 Tax=Neptuniibacter sp. QD29_5 TaxID=3398207 RepID=UPI0039F4AFA7
MKKENEALLKSYESWRQKYQEPDARPAAGASDIELEIYLEEARKREYAAIERLSIAYNNAQANARLAGFKITTKHIEVLDKFTADEISVLEAYELLDIDISNIPDTECERLSKLYVRDIYEEQLRRKNSASD